MKILFKRVQHKKVKNTTSKKQKQKKNTTSNCFCKDNHTETRKLLVYAAQN